MLIPVLASLIVQVAYPLLTLLTCLEDDASFRRNIDTHTEQMNRQLRVHLLFMNMQILLGSLSLVSQRVCKFQLSSILYCRVFGFSDVLETS